MTEKDFASKVKWEGGVVDALEYGLRAEDCEPGELHDAWKKLEIKWISMQPEFDAVNVLLSDIDTDEGEDG